MGKLYSIKSGEEIAHPIGLTAKQAVDKLVVLESNLKSLGLGESANFVCDAIEAAMRRVRFEERSANRAILKRNAELEKASK